MSKLPDEVISALVSDRRLWVDFEAICDCGGRLTGTLSEAAAQMLLRRLGETATGRAPSIVQTPYDGWTVHAASLHLRAAEGLIRLDATPLLRSASTPAHGLEAEVVSVGRGTEAEFRAAGESLRGRIALVRHEFMFASGHIHRRLKYGWAREAGAVGFLIAGPLPTRSVAGSSGRGREDGIPAFGISPEAATRLTRNSAGLARVQMHVEAGDIEATTDAILFDIGEGDEVVVLSAHLDGHDPAESAMDNASGCAVALAVARALAPHAGRFRRRLRLAFFSAEEWSLTGSRSYLAGLSEAERRAIRMNVNLDSVGGASRLTALCSDNRNLAEFVTRVTRDAALDVGVFLPLMANSDHANFAAAGIPALRLVAGFDEHASHIQYVLTAADTRDKVRSDELASASLAAAAIAWEALTVERINLALGDSDLFRGGWAS